MGKKDLCCAEDCYHSRKRGASCSFHCLPKLNLQLRAAWLKQIARVIIVKEDGKFVKQPWIPSRSSKLCSCHFVIPPETKLSSSGKKNNRFLSGQIPTIFSHSLTKPSIKPTRELSTSKKKMTDPKFHEKFKGDYGPTRIYPDQRARRVFPGRSQAVGNYDYSVTYQQNRKIIYQYSESPFFDEYQTIHETVSTCGNPSSEEEDCVSSTDDITTEDCHTEIANVTMEDNLRWFDDQNEKGQSQEFRHILRRVLKHEIRALCDRLSHAGEEALLLTVSQDDERGVLGSPLGKDFVFVNNDQLDGVSKEFLKFCKGGASTSESRQTFSSSSRNSSLASRPACTNSSFVSGEGSTFISTNHFNERSGQHWSGESGGDHDHCYEYREIKVEPVEMEYRVFQNRSDEEENLEDASVNSGNQFQFKVEPSSECDDSGDNTDSAHDSVDGDVVDYKTTCNTFKEMDTSEQLSEQAKKSETSQEKQFDTESLNVCHNRYANRDLSNENHFNQSNFEFESPDSFLNDEDPIIKNDVTEMSDQSQPKKCSRNKGRKSLMQTQQSNAIRNIIKKPTKKTQVTKITNIVDINESASTGTLPFIKSFRLYDDLSEVQCLICGEFVPHIRMKSHWQIHMEKGECKITTSEEQSSGKSTEGSTEHPNSDNLGDFLNMFANQSNSPLELTNQSIDSAENMNQSIDLSSDVDDEEPCKSNAPAKNLVLPFLQSFKLYDDMTKVQCLICKEFIEHVKMKTHWRIHAGDKPRACHCCKKSFMYIGSLRKHISTNHMNKPYFCDVCNKKFCGAKDLRAHFLENT